MKAAWCSGSQPGQTGCFKYDQFQQPMNELQDSAADWTAEGYGTNMPTALQTLFRRICLTADGNICLVKTATTVYRWIQSQFHFPAQPDNH
jgi:hypothetical protein